MNRRQFLGASLPLLAHCRAPRRRAPSQHRLHVRRRSRLRRRELLRRDAGQDAESGSRRGGRRAFHQRALFVGHLHAVALFAADRRVCVAPPGHGRPAGRRVADHPAGPLHAARHAERGRLPDRRGGQVASRPGRAQPRLEWRDFAQARSMSVSTTPSFFRPPATACLAFSWRTAAWSTWIPKTRSAWITSTRIPASRPARPIPNCSRCTPATATTTASSTASAGSAI